MKCIWVALTFVNEAYGIRSYDNYDRHINTNIFQTTAEHTSDEALKTFVNDIVKHPHKEVDTPRVFVSTNGKYTVKATKHTLH